jgi:hypothetical protein
VGLALSLVHTDSAVAALVGELLTQPALADAGRGDDADHLADPGEGSGERRLELGQLVRASDEARESTRPRHVQMSVCSTSAFESEDLEWGARAFHLALAERCELEEPFDRRGGPGGQVRGAGLGQRLHALSQPDRVAHGGVLHLALVADRPDDDLAGVDPDADGEVDALGAHLGRQLGDTVDHRQRGAAGALGVILACDGRAEQRHDAVAGELVDRAVGVVDGVGEHLEEAVHQLAPGLRVELLCEVHRSLDIGEQHGDLFALAFHGLAAGVDLPGHLVRNHERNLWQCGDRCAALGAELGPGRNLLATLGADRLDRERSAAESTEPGPFRVPMAAAATDDAGVIVHVVIVCAWC